MCGLLLMSAEVAMSAEALLGGHKDRFDVAMRALQGGQKAGPREMARIREREVCADTESVLWPPIATTSPPPPS
jgi:hypothetical protein